jgi:DNA (cytosine-5)-methyltransferase 1
VSLKTYGSLFAGVGGIDLGLDESGLECLFQVEIDEHCQQTLSYHWPNVPKFRDIKDVSGYDLPFVDVITFGSPCQDLSVAGKRAGFDGERSGLFFEATRIIKEMREKSNGQYPKWTIWENVTGALSSNGGADFGQALHEMDEAGACFSEWAVLDAQYFGVAQRRRRVYLLSVFDTAIASRCPDKVLPVNEGSSGDFKKSLKQGQEAAREVANCLRSGGEGGVPSSRGENLVVEIVGSLQARDYKGVGNQYVSENKLVIESKAIILDGTRVNNVRTYENDIAPCLTSRMGTGGNTVPMVSPQPITNIRRLTPLECERLMGWPDNHTLNRADGKINSDSARYKMCGNGVVSPVIKWVIEQIKQI